MRFVSTKTEQIVAIKFVREFENVCNTILHDTSSQKIDYMQMGEILHKLNFLKFNNRNGNESMNNMSQERN